MPLNFIWDLDGTLLDSYGAIMKALEATYYHYQWEFDDKMILAFILNESVGALLKDKARLENVDEQMVKSYYSTDLKTRDQEIQLMSGAREILDWTKERGITNFIYTHKGDNTFSVLKQLDLESYFTEVVTGDSGFKRKPHPEALDYLIQTHHLDKNKTYYIGDRKLDMEAALQAGIFSLNLKEVSQGKNQKIKNLLDIKNRTF
ncbi:HAD-IA family hydrolase [Streptococcus porcorum]|uniref:HAD superfamily hydrolase (TIGR01549 family) n=1 Tax=Streptococcus porcorum TaxID=701526 RepID=A0ABV2JD58_9STRE